MEILILALGCIIGFGIVEVIIIDIAIKGLKKDIEELKKKIVDRRL